MVECKKCLFNSSNNPSISLNEDGVCDICLINERRIAAVKKKHNTDHLTQLISEIKASKKGKYDCLIGISGGTDSSYLVYLAKKWGLNPLLLHVDGGWNSETSVINIEKIIDNCGFDFVTEVLPWHEMRDAQKAFIKADVIDIDLPFDNAMVKYNYLVAKKHKIKYILNGYSTITEGIMPESYNHFKLDKKNLQDIQSKFGQLKLKELKYIGRLNYFYFERIKKIKTLYVLDYFDYQKSEAQKTIKSEFNWKDYGGKHYENVFTRFYQGHILPIKFNVDKRVTHLSMLICSGQISKEEALLELQHPMYPSKLMERDDKNFFCKKLQLTESEFEAYLKRPRQSHRKFKSSLDIYDFLRPAYRLLKRMLRPLKK